MSTQTASILVIGNEILSGRTHDTNTNSIAKTLNEKGITLTEARVIPDDIETIIRHIRDLKQVSDIIFTTGGIGPTHDDKTAEAVAQACHAQLEKNQHAYDTLVNHYGDESMMNEGRTKMAMIPVGATLIDNPVSAAPGFMINNIYVMAGVPKIMQAMLDNIMIQLEDGEKTISRTIICDEAESVMAPLLSAVQDQFPAVDIGSYPQYNLGDPRVSIVIRHTDKEQLDHTQAALIDALTNAGIQHAF